MTLDGGLETMHRRAAGTGRRITTLGTSRQPFTGGSSAAQAIDQRPRPFHLGRVHHQLLAEGLAERAGRVDPELGGDPALGGDRGSED